MRISKEMFEILSDTMAKCSTSALGVIPTIWKGLGVLPRLIRMTMSSLENGELVQLDALVMMIALNQTLHSGGEQGSV